MIRECVSGDALYLALSAAKGDVNPTEEELEAFQKAVFHEHNRHCVWPKGF